MNEGEIVKGAAKASEAGDLWQLAAAMIAAGALGRVITAAHAGVRGVKKLALEAPMGALCGLIAGGGALYFDAALRSVGWPILVMGALCGLAGSWGTRLLDLIHALIRSRAPSDPK